MINKSNKSLSKPRGTRDILPTQALIYQQIQQITQNILNHAGYRPIILPTYEYQEVFTTSVGETTDIVQKEMFTFQDRKARCLVLRPEGTAGAVRLICQNKLVNSRFPFRAYYWGNMFRYERPQKGRYREFWQLGVELVNAQGLLADGELLWLIKRMVEELNLGEKVFLHWNYLGNQEVIASYKLSLKACLANKIKKFCLDCQKRYQTNPLRILDCKICDLPELPSYEKTLTESGSNFLNYLGGLREFLDKLEINHYYNEKLVRGLDYYTGIVFELLLDSGDNKQTVILGGGRYDQLFRQLGEKWNSSVDLPAAGFALGIDRLVDYFSSFHQQVSINNSNPDILFLILEKSAYFLVLQWKEKLSQKYKIVCNLDLTEESDLDESKPAKKSKSIFKNINHYSPHLVVTVGPRELADNNKLKKYSNNESKILVKDCQKKQNIWVSQAELINWIDDYLTLKKKSNMYKIKK